MKHPLKSSIRLQMPPCPLASARCRECDSTAWRSCQKWSQPNRWKPQSEWFSGMCSYVLYHLCTILYHISTSWWFQQWFLVFAGQQFENNSVELGFNQHWWIPQQELLFCWVLVPPRTRCCNPNFTSQQVSRHYVKLGIDKPWLKEVWTSATKHMLISKARHRTYIHTCSSIISLCICSILSMCPLYDHDNHFINCDMFHQLWYIIIISICEKYKYDTHMIMIQIMIIL